MKRFICILLSLSLLTSLSSPVFANSSSLQPVEIIAETYTSSDINGVFSESYSYTDSLGDVYNVYFSKSSIKTTTEITDASGFMVAKSEYIVGDDYITNTVPTLSTARTANTTDILSVERVDIDQFVNDDSSFNEIFRVETPVSPFGSSQISVASAGGDPVPGTTTYTFNKTYNTDYVYLGEILTGDGYYRKLSGYDEYNRASYTFLRNATIASIFTILGGVYSFLTGTTQILVLAGGMGIGVVGSAITMDWNLNACVRSFDFQFQCRMVYNNSTKIMSLITRQLEYLYGYDEYLGTDSYVFDSFSYSTPAQAINAHCSEAVGYGAAAFSAKYITGNYPNLVLPVSGPSYEWEW